jgi:hypothetical protein
MITKWKSHFLENASQVFSRKQDPRIKTQKELIESLYKKIGQKEIEVDFLRMDFVPVKGRHFPNSKAMSLCAYAPPDLPALALATHPLTLIL